MNLLIVNCQGCDLKRDLYEKHMSDYLEAMVTPPCITRSGGIFPDKTCCQTGILFLHVGPCNTDDAG